MRIDIRPPNIVGNRSPEEAIRILEEWSRDLTEQLNLVLNSIDEENLSANLKTKLGE